MFTWTLAAILLTSAGSPAKVKAQAAEATLGALGGAAVGVWESLSLMAARARADNVIHNQRALLVQILPGVALGAGAGFALGALEEERVDDAFLWGGVGWASGFGVGYLVGDWLWEDEAGRWAGAVIGSGAGLAIGLVLGALTADTSSEIFSDRSVALRFGLRF